MKWLAPLVVGLVGVSLLPNAHAQTADTLPLGWRAYGTLEQPPK